MISTRSAGLPFLFFTVLVDLVGFGIVLPLLPFYADRFGASGTEVGALVLVYSLIQLFMAPFWGRLSDRIGRRPVLILGLAGSAVSYVAFAFAPSLVWLFVSRVLAGIGGSTIPVAEAYIADITPPARRAAGLGLIGAAFGLGFTVGPALGGALSTVGTAAPGLLAAALCGGNALLALAFLRESLAVDARAASAPAEEFGLPRLLRLARDPHVLQVLAVYFLFSVAWSVLQPTLSLFSAQRFDFDERRAGYLFAFLGLVSALVQGGLVRRLVPRHGEAQLVRVAAFPFVAGLLTIGTAGTPATLLVGLGLLALGYGIAVPSALGLLSRRASDGIQGGTLGLGQSAGSLARMVGPLSAGIAFDRLGVGSPYLLGAAVALSAGLLALALRQPAAEVTEAEAVHA